MAGSPLAGSAWTTTPQSIWVMPWPWPLATTTANKVQSPFLVRIHDGGDRALPPALRFMAPLGPRPCPTSSRSPAFAQRVWPGFGDGHLSTSWGAEFAMHLPSRPGATAHTAADLGVGFDPRTRGQPSCRATFSRTWPAWHFG